MCTRKGITLETSSPYNPCSNGLAESAVKTCKKLFLKCIAGGEEFGPALLEFRNCPGADGFSPAQLMFGHRMRTALPAAAEAFAPIPLSYAKAARKKTLDEALSQIGKRRLEAFHEGDEVWVQNRITGGFVGPGAGSAGRWSVLFALLPQHGGDISSERTIPPTQEENR